MSFTTNTVRSTWRNTLLVRQLVLLALYPVTAAHAQVAPVGNGFSIDAEDVRFIFNQIEVAQAHAAGGALLGSGPNQVNLNGPTSAACDTGVFCGPDPQLPVGLRTVDGTFNNLVPIPDQHLFGSADRLFPRLTTPSFRPAEAGTSYATKTSVLARERDRARRTSSSPHPGRSSNGSCRGMSKRVCSPRCSTRRRPSMRRGRGP